MTYRPTTSLLLSALTATTLAACEPKGDLGEYTDTTADTGDSEAESGATTGASVGTSLTGSEGTGDTGDTSNTSNIGSEGSGDTGTGDTGDTGDTSDTGDACGEPELDFQANFEITIVPPLPPADTKITADCTVDGLLVEANFVHVELGCGERDVTIKFNVSTSFKPLFSKGDALVLTYHQSMPFWINQWFALRTPAPGGGLVLGGIMADALLPLDDDDSTLFDPVHLTEVAGVCPEPVDCEDPYQRLALNVAYDQTNQQVLSGNSVSTGMLTSVRVDLGRAVRHFDNDCGVSDTPPEWYNALIIMLPEG
ncbi:MAG TPA: hypothetical protein VGB85_19640 [Nannocystis sp.]|jgi:hypothetical protein